MRNNLDTKDLKPLHDLVEKWRGLRKSGNAFLSVSAYGTYEMAADELDIALTDLESRPSKPAFCRICGRRMNKRLPAILRVCAKCKKGQ